MALLQFNAEAVAPQQSFDPLPAGDYLAYITDSEIVPTKDGTGQRLKLRWDVIDGPMKGRVVFDGLNIVNKNPVAEEIAQRMLSGLCHATGVTQLQDTQQLHGIPVVIKVKIRRDESGQYGDSNEVAAYKKAGGMQPAPALQQVAPAQPAAQVQPAGGFGGAQQAPWMQNKAS
jgi:hypothetical protein